MAFFLAGLVLCPDVSFAAAEFPDALSASLATKPIVNVTRLRGEEFVIESAEGKRPMLEKWAVREIGFLVLEALELELSPRTLESRIRQSFRKRKASYRDYPGMVDIRAINEMFDGNGKRDGFQAVIATEEQEVWKVRFSFSKEDDSEIFSRINLNGTEKEVYVSGEKNDEEIAETGSTGEDAIEVLRTIDKTPDVVIWDWDRTLFETSLAIGGAVHEEVLAGIYSRAYGGDAESYLELGREYFKNSQGKTNVERYRALIKELEDEAMLSPGELDPEEYARITRERMEKHVRERLDAWEQEASVCFVPGAIDVLRELWAAGKKQYVVTGNPWLTEEILGRLGVGHYFDGVFSGRAWKEEGEYSKPAAFEKIARDNPDSVFMVIGDGAGELEWGRQLDQKLGPGRVFTVGLLYPPGKEKYSSGEKQMREASPDAIIHGGVFPDAGVFSEKLGLDGEAGDKEEEENRLPVRVNSWEEAAETVNKAPKVKYTEVLGYPHTSHQFRGVRKEGFLAAAKNGEIRTRNSSERTWWADPVSAVGISNKLDKAMYPGGFTPGSISIVFEIKGTTAAKYGIGSWGGGTYSAVPLGDIYRAWMVKVETEEDFGNGLVRMAEITMPGMSVPGAGTKQLSKEAVGTFWRIDRYLERKRNRGNLEAREYLKNIPMKEETAERDNLRELVEKGLLCYVKRSPGEEVYDFTVEARFARIHVKGSMDITPGSVANPDVLAYDILAMMEGSRKVSPEKMLSAVLHLTGQFRWEKIYREALECRKHGRVWKIKETAGLTALLDGIEPLEKRTFMDTRRIDVEDIAHDGIDAEKTEGETEDFKEAAKTVNDLAAASRELGEEEIREIHAILSRNLTVNDFFSRKKAVQRGRYRDREATRSLAICPVPEIIPEAMEAALGLVNSAEFKKLHPVEQASIAFYIFHNLQPFENGNTRTFSLYMNYILMKNNYPPLVLNENSLREFQTILRFMRKPEPKTYNEGSLSLGTFVNEAPAVISSPQALANFRKYAEEFTMFLAQEVLKELEKEEQKRNMQVSDLAYNEEKEYAEELDDELKLSQVSREKKISFLAVSTDWIHKCAGEGTQMQDIKRLLTAIRKKCAEKEIIFVEGGAEEVKREISEIKRRNRISRGAVIGEEKLMDDIENILASLGMGEDRNILLAGVRPEKIGKDSYIRICQMLKAVTVLLREDFTALPDPEKISLQEEMLGEHKALGLVFLGRNRILFDLPPAESMEYKDLRRIYESQIFA